MTKELFNTTFKKDNVKQNNVEGNTNDDPDIGLEIADFKSVSHEQGPSYNMDNDEPSDPYYREKLLQERRKELINTVLDLFVNVPLYEAKYILSKAEDELYDRCIVTKQEVIDGYRKNLR
jgi:hypothetical protein